MCRLFFFLFSVFLCFPSASGAKSLPVFVVFGDDSARTVGMELKKRLPGHEILVRKAPGPCIARLDLPRHAEYAALVFGSFGGPGGDPWANSLTWKRELARCVQGMKAASGKTATKLILAGPFPSPDPARHEELHEQQEWIRIISVQEKIPYADVWDDIAGRNGEWEGFKNDIRLYGPDGVTLAPGGAGIVAGAIVRKMGGSDLPVEQVGR